MKNDVVLAGTIWEKLKNGVVIPAHPLALDRERRLDERRQRALTRYYCDSGVGGIAVGVHTTQFEIRQPEIGLFEPVLTLAKEECDRFDSGRSEKLIRVAGIVGQTAQAVKEATLCKSLGYHLGLVSLSAFQHADNDALIMHLREVAEIIPVMGFYLQPAVGGRLLDFDFWRRAAEIENLRAIKIAAFNRYQTLEAVRGVAASGRAENIALYTGNDDNIVFDLLSEYQFGAGQQKLFFSGGLLGHWAVWSQKNVQLLDEIHSVRRSGAAVPTKWLRIAQEVTDANQVIFDAHNGFKGCIPGIHEILRRQGLLEGNWTLNPKEVLSAGQKEEIDRIYTLYNSLNDDTFVKENLDRWLR